MYVLRLKYKKGKDMKFLSHLDMVRLMERSFRRAGVPLEFTQGFNPHPKINFAMPLSVGISSVCEVVEFEIKEKIDVEKFIVEQRKFFPDGIEILSGTYVEPSKSLMSKVKASEFVIEISKIEMDEKILNSELNSFLEKEEILIEKTNKKNKVISKNIREGIFSIYILKNVDGILLLKMTVSSGSEFNVNPDDVVSEFLKHMKIDRESLKIRTEKLCIFAKKDDKFIDIYKS